MLLGDPDWRRDVVLPVDGVAAFSAKILGRHPLTPRERDLAERLAVALETIRQLRDAITSGADPPEIPGCPHQSIILAALRRANGRIVTREHLAIAINSRDPVADRTIDSHVHLIRRRGYSIETVRGLGFRITP